MDLAPEFRLFCLALRRPQCPEDAEALRHAVEATPDWEAIINGTRRHRVAPFVLAGLQACGSPKVPAKVLAALRELAVEAAVQSLAQVAEIGRLSRIFSDAGIRVLVLKGAVLSAQLYGDVGQRGPRDIDLLVDQDQFGPADAVLVRSGYSQIGAALSPRQSAAHKHWMKDFEYRHSATGTLVELHHRLTDNPNLLASDFGTLWNEREEVRLGDIAIATLPRQRLPLYLCAHGGGHGWERLRWLVDFAAALQQPESTARAFEAAEAAGLAPAMQHALLLAHDWLGLPVDERHLASARRSAEVKSLDRLLAHLYAGAAWHEMPRRGSWKGVLRYSVWQRLYRLSLKPDWRYRASQWMLEWFSPSDWDTVRLPDRLFWLYPVMRPLGWLIRRWR
jgi:hypothetical protein